MTNTTLFGFCSKRTGPRSCRRGIWFFISSCPIHTTL